MSYKIFTRLTMTIVFTLLIASGSAFGGTFTPDKGTKLPAYYPSSFQGAGIVSKISSNSLVASGRSYALSMSVLIHSLNTQHSSRYALGVGKELGFSYNTDSNNKRTITEVWILPDGTIKLP